MPPAPSRVVVGVQGSLTGLRALREAVAEARSRGVELLAVRTYTPAWSGNDCTAPLLTALGCEGAASRSECQARHDQAAIDHVERAFADAMGGVPRDLRVRTTAVSGPARKALVEAVRSEDDLLVVGASGRRWWRPVHRAISRYCIRRADCPVLVVPPNRAAREFGGRQMGRRLRVQRELMSLTTQ